MKNIKLSSVRRSLRLHVVFLSLAITVHIQAKIIGDSLPVDALESAYTIPIHESNLDEKGYSKELFTSVSRAADHFISKVVPVFPNRNPYLSHVYTLDLALEGLMELSESSGEQRWREHVDKLVKERNITPATLLPYQSQPFGSINYALFKATGDYAWLPVFVRESEIWRKDVRRSPEGSVLIYHREDSDLYALVIDYIQEYCSRMARCGKHTGDRTYFIEAVTQFRIARALFRYPDTGLWRQGRGWDEDKPAEMSPGAWSRGHGWLLKGMVESLLQMPRESAEYRELQQMLKEVIEALLPLQQPSGMWHTLLHRSPEESFPESSGTAMIATAFSKIHRENILEDDRLKPAAIKAFMALADYVDEQGLVLSTSPGPGPLKTEVPYLRSFRKEFKPGDTHGTFAMLFVAAEAIRLEKFDTEGR